MPQISSFLGIVIRMFFKDHNPPHFHAVYGGNEALININKLEILEGDIPPRVLGMVLNGQLCTRKIIDKLGTVQER